MKQTMKSPKAMSERRNRQKLIFLGASLSAVSTTTRSALRSGWLRHIVQRAQLAGVAGRLSLILIAEICQISGRSKLI
jgi:hypothetical protein